MIEWIGKWGWLITLFMQFGFGWLIWSARNAFVSKAEFQELDRRVTKAEGKIESAPEIGAMHDLGIKVVTLRGELSTLSAEMKGMREVFKRVERPLDLMMQHHIAEGSDK